MSIDILEAINSPQQQQPQQNKEAMDMVINEVESDSTETAQKRTANGDGGSGSTPVSKVLHVRNIPVDCSENELQSLGVPFGTVVRTLIMKGKTQAFVEMENEEIASKMCSEYTVNHPYIRDHPVYVQFSKRTVISNPTSENGVTLNPSRPAFNSQISQSRLLGLNSLGHIGGIAGQLNQFGAVNNSGTLRANSYNPYLNRQMSSGAGIGSQFSQHNLNAFSGTGSNSTLGVNGSNSSSASQAGNNEPAIEGQEQVIHIEIHQMLYGVTLETLYQVFCKYGNINRIITFTKKRIFQALIEYNSHFAARTALDLNGQQLYPNCNVLKIEFSKLGRLNVKYNNDKSRDFTNPNLPAVSPFGSVGDVGNASGSFGAGTGGAISNLPGSTVGSMAGADSYGSLAGFGSNSSLRDAGAMRDRYHRSISAFDITGTAGANLIQGYGFGNTQQQPFGQRGAVICVNNLDEEKVTPDILFTLIGVYADVQRVKIMYNKKSSALVQVTDINQANLAIRYLENVLLFNKPLHLTMSKHQEVAIPRDDPTETNPLNRDYSNSPLHRFRIQGSRNYTNITDPSQTLHLSNIPAEFDEEKVKSVFMANFGLKIESLRFFPAKGDKKMALVHFEDVNTAVSALVYGHNAKMDDKHYLRVSFSKVEM